MGFSVNYSIALRVGMIKDTLICGFGNNALSNDSTCLILEVN